MEMLTGGQLVPVTLSVTLVVVPQCWSRSLHLHMGLDGVRSQICTWRIMSSFQNLAVKWVLWSVLGGQGTNKYAVANAGLSCGAVGSFLGETTGPIPAWPWPDAQPLDLLSCIPQLL